MSDMDPTAIANQALDAIAWPEILGDIEDGSDHGNILLRAYRNCLQQLLRAAQWDFARRTAPLVLLADATGNTPDVGTVVPQPGWIYEYAYPTDCMKVRFIPWNWQNQANMVPPGNIQLPPTPEMTGIGQQGLIGQPLRPSRFVVATDFNYPPLAGQDTWDVQGVSPQGRTVILSNVRYATCTYTALMLYPSVWDALFRSALVAYLASEVAMAIWAKKDPKMGIAVRDRQIDIVRAKVKEARLVDGNEGFYSSDLQVDWINVRSSGGPWSAGGIGNGWGGMGPGSYGLGWDQLALSNGSAF